MRISSVITNCRPGLFGTALKVVSLLLLSSSVSLAQPYYPSSGRSPLAQYTNTAWSLQKTGSFTPGAEAGTGTVNWTVNYTQGATTRTLLALGYVEFANFDTVPAHITSFVVNLQVGGVTVTSNVATSALGDAATTATVDANASTEGLGSFSENAGSGSISLINGNTDAPVTLDGGGITVPVGAVQRVYFIATFDPAAVGIATGSPARAEVLVTFQNGYGFGFTHASLVPAPTALNAAPTLLDTAVVPSGTVTTSSFTAINQVVTSSGSASLSITADGGTNGGHVCNTATLTGDSATFPIIKHDQVVANFVVPGVSLTATNCQIVPPRTPTGDHYATFTPGGWGSNPNGNNPGARLAAGFASVYPSGVTIGSTHTLNFTSAAAIRAFLPQGKSPAALKASAINPTQKITVFAGQTLALKLNVDFSAAALMPGNGLNLGGLKVVSGKLAGWSVTQVLALCNQVLGGNVAALPAGVSISDLNDVADRINNNYTDGNRDNGYLAP